MVLFSGLAFSSFFFSLPRHRRIALLSGYDNPPPLLFFSLRPAPRARLTAPRHCLRVGIFFFFFLFHAGDSTPDLSLSPSFFPHVYGQILLPFSPVPRGIIQTARSLFLPPLFFSFFFFCLMFRPGRLSGNRPPLCRKNLSVPPPPPLLYMTAGIFLFDPFNQKENPPQPALIRKVWNSFFFPEPSTPRKRRGELHFFSSPPPPPPRRS